MLFSIFLLGLGILALMHPAHAQESQREVFILDVDGEIDPIVERYISRGIDKAENEGAHLVIIKLDTPGGLLSSTEKIVGNC